MNEHDEMTFQQFARRFAQIETLVPDPPPFPGPSTVGHRPTFGSLARVAVLIGAVILLGAAIMLAAIGSQPASRQYVIARYPDAVVTCEAFRGPLPSRVAGDPCPSAVRAVEEATLSIGVPVVRVTIRPGPFGACGDVWSVATPAPSCLFQRHFDAVAVPGTLMHAWVAFADTDRVLPLDLWRPLLAGTDTPLVGPSGMFWSYDWASSGSNGWQSPPPGWVFP